MTSSYLQQLDNYYRSWKGQTLVDLNFRFIKILARTMDDPILQWYNFHQLVNKRRITNDQFPSLIQSILDEGIYPLRIFQSCTEWLAPNEVWTSDSPRIIRSGFMALENDDSLEKSLETARQLVSIVDDATYIFSGNKSIHVWVPISLENMDDTQLAYADQREKVERNYRYELFSEIRNQVDYELDNRIAADTRRVVPMPNTINAMTGRIVVSISEEDVLKLSPEEISQKTDRLSIHSL